MLLRMSPRADFFGFSALIAGLGIGFGSGRITETSDKYDPEGRVVRSSQTTRLLLLPLIAAAGYLVARPSPDCRGSRIEIEIGADLDARAAGTDDRGKSITRYRKRPRPK
jgi:hypothetical protein